jgi:CheY-like chemotaxis protein
LGIGLTVASKIAQAAGGTLSVDTQVGKGSTFTLVLPASVGMLAPAPVVEQMPEAAVARDVTLGAEVLLVDTHKRLLEPFSNLLVDAGFSVEYVVGEEEGLARLADAPFGVVVSFIDTQIVNGFTFSQRSRKAKDKPYFIAWDAQTKAFSPAAQNSLFDAVVESTITQEGFLDAVEKGLKRL